MKLNVGSLILALLLVLGVVAAVNVHSQNQGENAQEQGADEAAARASGEEGRATARPAEERESANRLVGQPTPRRDKQKISFWELVKAGGLIEAIIILCSVVAMALVIEHFTSVRFAKTIPDELVIAVRDNMEAMKYDEAARVCQATPCFFSDVVIAGLQKLKHDFSAVQEAITATVDKGGSSLHSKVSYLSLIAAVTPMLGLLGTVWGMINAFSEIAYQGGAESATFLADKASILAEGVYQALVTTLTGLAIAIPAMGFFFFFRDKVNKIIIEVESTAFDIFESFRPTRRSGGKGKSQ